MSFPKIDLAHASEFSTRGYLKITLIISAPKRNFEIAFRMFDLDGNGVVDADEFDKVTEIIMKGTTVAKQHKTKKRQSNISRYFFGESKSSL